MTVISLHNRSDISYTQIPNILIDEYMKQAHGAFVKVYLKLIRLLARPDIDLSLDLLADKLELTEKDVLRAISYWEKNSLLEIKRTGDGVIYDIGILNPATEKLPENINIMIPFPEDQKTDSPVETAGEDEFSWLSGIVEKYMERTLSPADVDLLYFIYNELGFSSDLILHLYEYCIEKGKKSCRYIQKVAIDWANNGITTVVEAKGYSASYDRDYMNIMKSFGINSAPAPAQKKYIDCWYSYGFSNDIIREACNRTMIAINEPSFKYANGILENWRDRGLFTIEAINAADTDHAAKTADKPSRTRKGGASNSFNSYEQRSYSKDDYSSIEQQLLGRK